MKKSSALLIAAAFILSSCGTVAQYASSDNDQQFQDGIYSNTPAFRTKVEKEESKSDTQALIEKTQESPIYLFGDKKDTVMIPKDMSAVIRYDQKLGGTVVTVGENPYDWRYDLENNYGYYYDPYSIGSSWYWSRHYNPWYSWSFAPWRYHGWYDPWYYSGYWGWYDPWYYSGYWGGWYDPWYYGSFWGGGWYYTGYYPHYGWYDPYWGHHHHHVPGYTPDYHKDVWYGSRHQTGSERLFAGTSSLRGGIGSRSTVSRNESAGRTASTAVRASSSNRTSVSRTPAGRAGSVSTATAPTRVSSGNRTTVSRTTPSIRDSKAPERMTGTVSRPASDVSRGTSVSTGRASTATGRTQSVTTTQPNYRKPAVVTSDRSSSGSSYIGSGSSASGRSAVSSGSQSGYNRGSASSSSSSSYNRSSSTSTSRSSSSFSSGSSSRSSSGGGFSGGGASRSGGSAGGRR